MYLHPIDPRFWGDRELGLYLLVVVPLSILLLFSFNRWKMGKLKKWKVSVSTPKNDLVLAIGVVGVSVFIGVFFALL